MLQSLIKAIQKRNLLSFEYKGKHRIVEPHAVGETLLRAWQVGEGWKLFKVALIQELAVTLDTFEGPREGYAKNDRQIPVVLEQL